MSASTYPPLVLIQRLKDYDEQAWELFFTHIYRRLRQDVTASLLRRHLSVQDADDVVQETLLTAYQKIDGIHCDDLTALYHWVRVISFNHVRNRARQKGPSISLDAVEQHNPECDTAVDAFLYGNGCCELPIENAIILREDIAQITAALSRIKPRDREIFLRRYLDGEKPHELSTRFPDLKARSISQVLIRTRRAIQERCAGAGQ